MKVVITDCDDDEGSPNPVFVEMRRLLSDSGVDLEVDNGWSDDYARADLIIGADPLHDSEVILDTRVLGQRTLNRFTRLEAALATNAPVARFCSPAHDEELLDRTRDWGDTAVLKYDWSMRRNGVFLWPLSKNRRPFPVDFTQGRDLFMEFLPGDPLTYKIDAFAGEILGSWVLPTRHMTQPDWQVVTDPNTYWFDPPVKTGQAIRAVSKRLLGHGAGYVSFDLMRTEDDFKIIEMNTCGVGTSAWKYWPERYAANYARGILSALSALDLIPRYRALRIVALHENNDSAAATLKPKHSQQETGSINSASPTDGQAPPSAESLFFEDLLSSERAPPKRVMKATLKTAEALVRHAFNTVPFYRERLAPILASDGTVDWEKWQDLPLLRDRDVAENRDLLLSRNLPVFLGAVAHSRVVGSSGQAFTVTRSVLQLATDSVVQARLYHWFGIDPTATMATLLPADETAYRSSTWCPYWWSSVSGTEHHGNVSLSGVDQLRWLGTLGDIYPRTTPSAIRNLAEAVRDAPDLVPSLKGVLTQADIVTDDLRDLCRRHLAAEIIDCYRRPDTGFIALRCPAGENYHIQSETCLLEVVDDEGNICGPGKAARSWPRRCTATRCR